MAATCKSAPATIALAIKRPLTATTTTTTPPATVQRALIPGERAGPYQEPDHAAGEAAWPGKQAPTRQLSLFGTEASVKTPDRPRRADPTPSPTQARTTQTRLTTFVGFPPSSPSPSDAALSSEDDTDD